MEIILAIVVVTAVIFFGALLSAGNERQRKAIDGLREQAVLWALQDLRIKRERLARDVQIDDPLGWFNRITAKARGHNLNLQVVEYSEKPRVLICSAEDAGTRVVFTLSSPAEIQAMKRAKGNQLSRYADRNLLLSLPRGAIAFECSVLNCGILFDLELSLAWKGLTGNSIDETGFMWIYMLS